MDIITELESLIPSNDSEININTIHNLTQCLIRLSIVTEGVNEDDIETHKLKFTNRNSGLIPSVDQLKTCIKYTRGNHIWLIREFAYLLDLSYDSSNNTTNVIDRDNIHSYTSDTIGSLELIGNIKLPSDLSEVDKYKIKVLLNTIISGIHKHDSTSVLKDNINQ